MGSSLALPMRRLVITFVSKRSGFFLCVFHFAPITKTSFSFPELTICSVSGSTRDGILKTAA